ncbi:hypothetical protein QFC19_003554 [Naganishia cerealis]|uniref:Uncharacterized protein n=1 Tax=Naganishia cerealis TaxID=610337 RepID=A0ACC2W4L1_9TREE|nr:hypothetical protein QFC19_003554 [Naganishia cerealis]
MSILCVATGPSLPFYSRTPLPDPSNSLRLEIPCIYQKVGTGNKKRKRKGKDGEEEEDMDEEEEEGDPEIVKAKEKPFYSLLLDDTVAPNHQEGSTPYRYDCPPGNNQHGSLNTGYQLPFNGGTGEVFASNLAFSLDGFPAANPNDYLHQNGQMLGGSAISGSAAFPLLEQGTGDPTGSAATVSNHMMETLANNPSPMLTMFTQSLGINQAEAIVSPHNAFPHMQNLATADLSPVHPSQRFNGDQNTRHPTSIPAPHTLGAIFSPLTSATNVNKFSPHGSSPDSTVQGGLNLNVDTRRAAVEEQETIEEGTSPVSITDALTDPLTKSYSLLRNGGPTIFSEYR